ncbi:GAF domain-containing protein [Candidatus Poribacteria bacterium]|nr:GAF domain-containing protein [Candidatus Poribacteria bacterium]
MFCPRCGRENDEQAQFCQGCGTNFKNLGRRLRKTKIAVQYAGFWRRFVAAFIDISLTIIVLSSIVLPMIRFLKVTTIVWLIIPWIYSAIMESSSKQATLGKMALGIIVTDLEGRRISFVKATGRHFCKILSILSFFIGFIIAGFTKKKQALHDMMTNCLLVLREFNVLMQVAQQMSAIHDLDELLKRMLDEIVQVMGARRGLVMLRDNGEFTVKVSRNINQEIIASDKFQFSRNVLSEVERTGEPRVITNVRSDKRFATQANVISVDFSSILCVPLKTAAQVIGLIYIDNHLVKNVFTERDLELIMAFANQVAIAIENANLRQQEIERQRLEQEIADAREMQLSLLPKSAPQIEGFDIAGVCEPAAEVGGDYFTYLWMDATSPPHPPACGGDGGKEVGEKTQLGIVLMDVTGHGMKAATTTFLANGMLQSEIKSGKPPGRIMTDMHQSLQEILSKNAFVTMSFALIDTRQKILTCFNAGLPKPILIRNGKFAELDIQSSIPLGCRFPADYVGTSVPLLSGDVLLFHSDGLSEAEDVNEQMYEYTRMGSLLSSLASQALSAQAWLDAILTDVLAFTEPEPDDDLTVVVVRVL